MAGRRKKDEVKLPETREEKIAHAVANFCSSVNTPPKDLIAPPKKMFLPGDKCQVGNLLDCVVVDTIMEGKAVIVEYNKSDRDTFTTGCIGVWWWFSALKYKTNSAETYFRPYRRGQVSSCDLDSLIHMYSHDGLVCNPEYQRGYVWTPFDKEQLLESIFDRLQIGSFVMVRNHSYLHEKSTAVREYINLQGERVMIPMSKNDTIELIDGQQRITTIVHFMLDQLTYRGKYYSELSFRDRCDFAQTSVSYRIINAEDISRKEILEMFLQVNRGVPQEQEHLDKVRALYENELNQ